MARKPRKQSVASLKRKAWAVLSLIIRQGSADHRGMCTCYTCGKQDGWKFMDAGHAIGGRTGAILFDEELLRPQCKVCNIWKNGNYTIYTTNLIKEHGMEWWENKLIESRKIRKWTRGDLLELIESYKARLVEIEGKEAA